MLTVLWDPVKDKINLQKHGLPLSFGESVLRNAIHSFEDRRMNYGERRFVTFGKVDGRLFVAMSVPREDCVRLISVRRANAREQRRYG